MKQKFKGILIGIILGAMISAQTVFAVNTTLQKDVTYRNIKIAVDGSRITPTDANGNYVEPFIIDGTTYLPVRAVANAFGKDVSWDDATSTVSLGEKQITAESIEGVYTWEVDGYVLTLTLNADNTGSLTDDDQTETFSWTLDGKTVTLNNPNYPDDPAIFSVNGNQLHGHDEIDGMIFTKKTETATITIIEPATVQKDVTYRDIKIEIDGNAIIPTDANGNPVEPFIMDGTTYLPVRAISTALGQEVSWNGDTSTVYIGKQPAETTGDVAGTYLLTELLTDGVPFSDGEIFASMIVTLYENGTGSIWALGSSEPITWTQNGNTITTVENENIKQDMTVEGNQLIIEADNSKMIFTKSDDPSITEQKASVTMKTVTVDKTNASKPIVTIEMADGGVIRAELYPDIAPITVENFISLIEKGFYNGLTFHRNIPGFVIQGGCPAGNGTGGPGYTIKGEFFSNGVENNLKHTRGVLSMARAQDPDSAGSQFFIMHADAPHLDGEYAAFGMVIEGMDVVDNIANSGK